MFTITSGMPSERTRSETCPVRPPFVRMMARARVWAMRTMSDGSSSCATMMADSFSEGEAPCLSGARFPMRRMAMSSMSCAFSRRNSWGLLSKNWMKATAVSAIALSSLLPARSSSWTRPRNIGSFSIVRCESKRSVAASGRRSPSLARLASSCLTVFSTSDSKVTGRISPPSPMRLFSSMSSASSRCSRRDTPATRPRPTPRPR